MTDKKIYILRCSKCFKEFEREYNTVDEVLKVGGLHTSNGCRGEVKYFKIKENINNTTIETKIVGEVATKEDFIEISKNCIESLINYNHKKYLEDNNCRHGYNYPKYCSICGSKLNQQILCKHESSSWDSDRIRFELVKVCIPCMEQERKNKEEEEKKLSEQIKMF